MRKHARAVARLTALAAGLSLALSLHAAESPIKNGECLECHNDKTLNLTNSAGRVVSFYVDEALLAGSVHRTNTCISCHADLTRRHPDDDLAAKPVDCARCHARQSDTYAASVHGIAFRNRDISAATCTDCHDSHGMTRPDSPASPLNFTHLAETCGACHQQEAADFAASTHGQAVAAGHRDAPTCTDCHSEHKIEGLKGMSSLQLSVQVCGKCHASEQLNTKYNLPADRMKTFFESYHGLAAQYGSTRAANCASCHGVHKILPSSDPRSTINQAHLVETCGKCHPGATENFALSKVHVDATSAVAAGGARGAGSQVSWWVRRIYLVLIAGVIGAMFIHNGLIFARKVSRRLAAEGRSVVRMSLSQRWQHAVLAGSFMVLAITGFALKFPDSWLALALGSSEPFRRWTHRVAGVILLGVGAYHLVYVMTTRDGRRLARDLFPIRRDATDVWGMVCHLVGTRREKPKIGRFGYAEKMEYWAVVWGTIIMGATGLAVWFKMDVTRFLPRWVIEVSLTIHYYEAVLACLAIVVWHFYHVIFDPGVYPLNPACWDGKVSDHWQREEHPLEQVGRTGRDASGSGADQGGVITTR